MGLSTRHLCTYWTETTYAIMDSDPVSQSDHENKDQWCPIRYDNYSKLYTTRLSPFIVALHPHFRATCTVNNLPFIHGFQVGDRTYKTAAYADDLLFFITQSHITMPNLCETFTLYSYIFNFKVNYKKSETLNLSLKDNMKMNAQNNCKFKWEEKVLKYLGVWLTPKLNSLYTTNFQPLLQAINKDLEKWSLKYFSWFCRAAIVKMTILPRILYFFQTIPILLPTNFFRTLKITILLHILLEL